MIQSRLPPWPDRDKIPETEHGLVPRQIFRIGTVTGAQKQHFDRLLDQSFSETETASGR